MIEIEDGSRWEDVDQDVWRYNAATGLFEGETTGLLDRDLAGLVASFGPIMCQKTGKVIFQEDVRIMVTPSPTVDGPVNRPGYYRTEDSKVPMLLFNIREDLAERLSSDFLDRSVDTYENALSVLLQKNLDYGSKNISQSPGGALNGLRVRMWDKTARINNLIDSGAEPENESLQDSFLDLMNYSAIAMMVLAGHWPDGKEST